jgi:hypothetical protein
MLTKESTGTKLPPTPLAEGPLYLSVKQIIKKVGFSPYLVLPVKLLRITIAGVPCSVLTIPDFYVDQKDVIFSEQLRYLRHYKILVKKDTHNLIAKCAGSVPSSENPNIHFKKPPASYDDQ